MQYDLVIVGTTIAGLGLAKTVKQDQKVLIVNSTEMAAYEFVNTYKLTGVYSQGAEYYKKFLNLGVDILLASEITWVHNTGKEHHLEIFSGTGFLQVKAKTLVDTTERYADIMEKSLNCLLVNKCKGNIIEDCFEGISLIPEPDEHLGLMIMKYKCPVEMNMLNARHKLIDFWRNRPKNLYDWKIASIGCCFEVQPVFGLKEISQNHILLPSAYYNTPDESYKAGMELGRRLLS